MATACGKTFVRTYPPSMWSPGVDGSDEDVRPPCAQKYKQKFRGQS